MTEEQKESLETEKHDNYYDSSSTITTALAINPNDFDHPSYNRETVYQVIERYARRLTVSNDGTDTLFVIVSHGGVTNFTKEVPIYPGENKVYYNVFEIRLRSPTAGVPYRVTEYQLCCKGGTTGSSSGFSPIQKANIHNQALPAANANWLVTNLTPSATPTTFRIMVSVTVSGNFQAVITKGGNSQTVTFNTIPGPALDINGLYIFDLMVHSGDSVNFSYSVTGGTIQVLRVQEIDAAVS